MANLVEKIILNRKIKILEQGFTSLSNTYFLKKEYDDNFIDDFNKLVSEIFDENEEDEYVFSESLVATAHNIVTKLPKIIKESYISDSKSNKILNFNYINLLDVLKEQLYSIIIKEEGEFVIPTKNIIQKLSELDDKDIISLVHDGKAQLEQKSLDQAKLDNWRLAFLGIWYKTTNPTPDDISQYEEIISILK